MQEAGRKGDRGAVAEGRESNPVDHTLAIRRALAPLRFDDMPDRHEAHHDYAWLWRQDVKQWLMRAYGIGTRVRWELAQLDEDATPALAERVGEISYAELVAVVRPWAVSSMPIPASSVQGRWYWSAAAR